MNINDIFTSDILSIENISSLAFSGRISKEVEIDRFVDDEYTYITYVKRVKNDTLPEVSLQHE